MRVGLHSLGPCAFGHARSAHARSARARPQRARPRVLCPPTPWRRLVSWRQLGLRQLSLRSLGLRPRVLYPLLVRARSVCAHSAASAGASARSAVFAPTYHSLWRRRKAHPGLWRCAMLGRARACGSRKYGRRGAHLPYLKESARRRLTLVRVSNSGRRRAQGQVLGIIEFGLRAQGVAVSGRCEHHARARERKKAHIAATKRRSKASAHLNRRGAPLEQRDKLGYILSRISSLTLALHF